MSMLSMKSDPNLFDILNNVLFAKLDIQSLAAASHPRLSETVPKLILFETSCYAFCERYCFECVVSQR